MAPRVVQSFSMNNRHSLTSLKIAVSLVAGLAAMVAAEAAYRGWLYFRYPQQPTFFVLNKVNQQLDREFGLSYIPNSDALNVYIVNGIPVSMLEMNAYSLGNMGREPDSYDTAPLKILVFGDSFTANGHDGVTWTDLLQETLSKTLSKRVSVVNFGRDGYGILQIFDLAAAQVARLKPDLVIMAFISDDLTRPRFWLMSDEAKTRVFRFAMPPGEADLRRAKDNSQDSSLIDSRVTKEWFEGRRRNPTAADPLLPSLLARRTQLENRSHHSSRFNPYWSLTSFFLYNRLVYGYPIRGALQPRGRLDSRIAYDDFAADARFGNDIATLKSLGVPYAVVHFPIFAELEAGMYLLADQERSLLQSLTGLTGKQPIDLVQDATGVDDNRKLFMLPDNHASADGNRFYARSVGEALIQDGIVRY